ncbi:Radical SAM domain protein [Pyrobaculum islandicum DSM 4184]|uniref:Radical SAM domain protein n=1 Tax=Pyrobaculum islandicum (strain DSM 4184 / JCM 9189 / GEO3) TaxID=384616 RepID=A1RQY9_PYRIL|nr:radical SAM protein [Pyrobaculum islandicum]ABL87371.1 Radical SAM domain protein [Pyrobaculum islandicum DSM 4184]
MEAWRRKLGVVEKLRTMVDIKRVERDHHAKRLPRPCGITIHTGVGCPLACAYCYIYDMGFPGSVRPYPLTPLEMAYAIAANPHVAVGERGTLVAVGSVTEPFLPETRELALGYIAAVVEHLGNPVQVATKYPPPLELAKYRADVLISVTDVEGRLEPKAPKPVERIRGAGELVKRGGSATLFVRPIVPGVTDRDLERLLALAWDAGIRRVVFGTLRATPAIAARLRSFGVDITPYIRRLEEGRQVPIKYPKERLVETARKWGFEVLPASCASNILAHGQKCALCSWGPCGGVPEVDVEDVRDFLEYRGYRGADPHFDGRRVVVKVRLKRGDKIFLEQALRVPVVSQGKARHLS